MLRPPVPIALWAPVNLIVSRRALIRLRQIALGEDLLMVNLYICTCCSQVPLQARFLCFFWRGFQERLYAYDIEVQSRDCSLRFWGLSAREHLEVIIFRSLKVPRCNFTCLAPRSGYVGTHFLAIHSVSCSAVSDVHAWLLSKTHGPLLRPAMSISVDRR